jgi:hypothetical protein
MTSRDITFAAAGASGGPEYVDDVFSTFLYTGNGSTQTITNNVNLSGEGGLVWIKSRSAATDHQLFDTARGATKELISNSISAEITDADTLTAFNADGFSLGADSNTNTNAARYCSWTFREAPKFFDVVTFTSGANTNRRISHNLDSIPGMIILKRTDGNQDWFVYHRDATRSYFITLNSDGLATFTTNAWGTSNPTSTDFGVNEVNLLGGSGRTYVAYLFAHDAGGFGAAGTDNIVSCGGYDGNDLNNRQITLGYEPQFLLFKAYTSSGDWILFDNIRGVPINGSASTLRANLNIVEGSSSNLISFNATGFTVSDSIVVNSSSTYYIYMAIRRPMKPPTSGAQVFTPVAYTGTNVDNRLVDTGIVTDMTMARIRTATSTGGFYTADRLRGNASLGTVLTSAENTDEDSFMTPTAGYGNSFSAMNGFGVGNDATRQLNQSSTSQLAYAFQRRPTFFDVVCYAGTGSNTTQTHNLGVVPELMIVRRRSTANAWAVYANNDNTDYLVLNTDAATADNNTYWNDTTPTSSVFSVGTNTAVNASGSTYVAYLFASVAGVSKIGSYTGTGATQTINAALPTGARFVMIKRTDSTGSWWVWDTARGMVTSTDPRLTLNTTAAEVNNDWVLTTTNGFQIVTTDATVNASGGTYIYLAIA